MSLSQVEEDLKEYESQSIADPVQADESLLLKARKTVELVLKDEGTTKEAVHLAHKIYGYFGDEGLEKIISLMKKYVREPIPNRERYWAYWTLVDNLALLKKCEEMIDEQLSFLKWTKRNMDQKYWLRAMYDSTQALCWEDLGRIDEWFSIYYDLINNVSPTQESRFQRAYYVFTAANFLAINNRNQAAIKELMRLDQINNEDPQWRHYKRFEQHILDVNLTAHYYSNNLTEFERLINLELIKLRNEIKNESNQEKDKSITEAVGKAHNLGLRFILIQRYQVARELLEYSVKHGMSSHFWLAICVWCLEKDRKKTLHLLEQATKGIVYNFYMRGRYLKLFLEQKEFADVHDDEDFLAVLRTDA